MTVEVISDRPMKPKQTLCSRCTWKLRYTGVDVKERKVSFMGDTDVEHYIICPKCGYHSRVKPW